MISSSEDQSDEAKEGKGVGWIGSDRHPRVVEGRDLDCPEFPSHLPFVTVDSPRLAPFDISYLCSRSSPQDGLFAIQRRRAGAHDQSHREEAGESTFLLHPSMPRTLLVPCRAAHSQMQDFMRLYSGLVERCFNTCVNDFTSKALTGNEVSSSSRFIPS